MLRLFNRRDPMAGSIRDTRVEELEAEIALLRAEVAGLRFENAELRAALQRHLEGAK